MFVQDCNSTHGTYLQKRKLDSGIEYRVNDGELVTFGQQVTSGTGMQAQDPQLLLE